MAASRRASRNDRGERAGLAGQAQRQFLAVPGGPGYHRSTASAGVLIDLERSVTRGAPAGQVGRLLGLARKHPRGVLGQPESVG